MYDIILPLDIYQGVTCIGGVNVVEQVLKEYGIRPVDILPVTEKVYKMSDGSRNFALKKTQMSNTSLDHWRYLLEQCYKINFSTALPVYLTQSNSLYVREEASVFYLTPWIESSDKPFDANLSLKLIGQFHNQTKRIQPIDTEQILPPFEEYLAKNNYYDHYLLSAVQRFEQNHYMSPFELLVCTQYINIKKVLKFLKETTEKFLEVRKDKSTWNICLCHGQLLKEHFIQSQQVFIINWENTRYGHAFQDVMTLFDDLVSNYRINHQLLIESFQIYLRENEFENDELYLLIIYLLDCQDYLEELNSYLTADTSSQSMINRIITIQKIHRRLMFGIAVAEFVDDREMELELDADHS